MTLHLHYSTLKAAKGVVKHSDDSYPLIMFTYRTHGLNIASDYDLHLPQRPIDFIDITIHHHKERMSYKKIDSTHHLLNIKQEPQAKISKTQDGELLIEFYKSGFFIKKGKELHITRECADEDFFRAILNTQILPLTSSLYHITLHGGVVASGDQAVIYLAPEGHGKSTLTAFLQKNQHVILSDDVAPLDITEQGIDVFPGLPEIRLNKDSCHNIYKTVDYPQKLAKLKVSTETVPLKKYRLQTIFILNPQSTESSSFLKTTLNPSQAFSRFIQNQFHWDIWQQQALHKEFFQLTQIAEKVTTYELQYPFCFQSLPWVSQQIFEPMTNVTKNLSFI